MCGEAPSVWGGACWGALSVSHNAQQRRPAERVTVVVVLRIQARISPTYSSSRRCRKSPLHRHGLCHA